ncbi:MAG: peptidoglycan-binding protein, partial [Planctomycetota bacterium]
QTLLPVGRRYAHHEEITPKITQLNAAIHALAKKSRKVELLDLHKLYRDRDGYLPDELTGDGLHLKPQAYERWTRAVLALPGLPAPLPPAKLKRGDRGNDVLELQRALTGLGYSVGTVDGIFGGDTESALKAFQRDHKLAPDGELRADTTEALARALKRGKPERDATSAEPARLRDGGDEIGVELKGGGPIRAVRHKDAILAFQYRAKMAICADGATNVTRDKSQADADPALLHDPWYQPRTAMNFAGEPVDADSVPYIVLPPPVYKATGAQKGDLCEVVYRGRRRYAIYAEVGPKTKIGEASMFLARELGIDDDPRRGGISAQEVTYTVLVGSGRPRGIRNGGPAVTDKDIQRLGAEAFAQARRQGLLE